ncbi:MAG TPA: saccharopine dehydrogenase C-terminal domain-containing protein [Ferruginibacter sp.]|nr:saccharopine dehydrogenase C-terminal domain-containing protein [Ferruginibacter sp.]HMP21430.1 saccharopine dehydrogenase C-terminal domain-containing protein [Ferruginibacter sp.]
MKTILLIGAGKSAAVLIDYLVQGATQQQWHLIIADASKATILDKINHSTAAEAIALDITDAASRSATISRADIVISLLPPALHFLAAKDCIQLQKHLLTASYLDDNMKSLKQEIENRQLLFLCEMGLDPGIDHMSAMQLVDGIKKKGGKITSFKSHCGGLVAPENDDNPWHYKISWNPRNVVLAGKAGAEYKWQNKIIHTTYAELFSSCTEVIAEGLGTLAYYPNRNSLGYMPLYGLEDAATFIRTTLRHPAYCKGWNAIVQAGLTDDTVLIDASGLTYSQWAAPVAAYIQPGNKEMLHYLGLMDDTPVPARAKTSADILQHLLETRLQMQPNDKDMIVMLHEIEYSIDGKNKKMKSSLVVKGEDSLRTAMAKTVGLPLGIAAKCIIDGTIMLRGLQVPVLKEIYDPVLQDLARQGIVFNEHGTA